MTWLLTHATALDTTAQAHEEGARMLLDQADDARAWARLYRGLHDALEGGDVARAIECATRLDLEIRIRDGQIEAIQPETASSSRDAVGVAVATRGGRR